MRWYHALLIVVGLAVGGALVGVALRLSSPVVRPTTAQLLAVDVSVQKRLAAQLRAKYRPAEIAEIAAELLLEKMPLALREQLRDEVLGRKADRPIVMPTARTTDELLGQRATQPPSR